jgi:metal-responsive CopG/Arc/MetJ family transcriptional regulator
MVEVKELVRVPISVTLPKECVNWLDKKVESRVCANRSHAIEVLILEAMKAEKKE